MNAQPIIILSGPSGVGKDTVIDAWKEIDPRIERVIAATTRAPRHGETNGVDYHFLSTAQFQKLIVEDGFLEHKTVFGNSYGTPKSGLTDIIERGNIPLLKIDVQGALSAMAILPEAVSIFLLPPSEAELERRIRERATDSPESIARRLATAAEEMAQAPSYRFQIINRSVEDTVAELQRVLGHA